MRKLKIMGMVSAVTMAMVMAVSLTGCGDDASSVSRATKNATKSISQDKDIVSKSDNSKSEDKYNNEEAKAIEINTVEAEAESNESNAEDNYIEEQTEETISSEEEAAFHEWEDNLDTDSIKEQAAIQNAIQGASDQIGEGEWRCVSSERTVSPGDGFDCWKVGVVNDADSDSPTYYFYCNYGFCIMEN